MPSGSVYVLVTEYPDVSSPAPSFPGLGATRSTRRASPRMRTFGTFTFGSFAGLKFKARTPVAPTILEAIRKRMAQDSALADLSGVFVMLPRIPRYPVAMVNPINEHEEQTQAGTANPAWYEAQISILDFDAARGRRLLDAAFDSLLPGRGRLYFQDGADSAGRNMGVKTQIPQQLRTAAGQRIMSYMFRTQFYITRFHQ